MRFGGSAHMKQGNRLEDLSLPTLICPPSCDCATAACVRVCAHRRWDQNGLGTAFYETDIKAGYGKVEKNVPTDLKKEMPLERASGLE